MILLSLDATNSLIFVRYRQNTLLIKYELKFIIIWGSKTFSKIDVFNYDHSIYTLLLLRA